jgi:hypothetical protein
MWTCAKCWTAQWSTNRWCSKCWTYKPNGGGKGRGGSWACAQSPLSSQPSPSPLSDGTTATDTPDTRSNSVVHMGSHDKKLEKETRAAIGRLTNSLRCLPQDSECTPGIAAIKTMLTEQLAREKENLRSLKPLDLRLRKTREFVADRTVKLQKVQEQIAKLQKDENNLMKAIATNSESIRDMERLLEEDMAGQQDDEDAQLAELLHLALSSNNMRAKQLALAMKAKQGTAKTARALFQESEDEMEEDVAADPYQAVETAGWEGGQDTWDQMFSHIDQQQAAPSGGAGKASAVVQPNAKTAGAVKLSVEKIHKDQKSMRERMLAQAAKTAKKLAGKTSETEDQSAGFPQIADNPEDY